MLEKVMACVKTFITISLLVVLFSCSPIDVYTNHSRWDNIPGSGPP